MKNVEGLYRVRVYVRVLNGERDERQDSKLKIVIGSLVGAFCPPSPQCTVLLFSHQVIAFAYSSLMPPIRAVM